MVEEEGEAKMRLLLRGLAAEKEEPKRSCRSQFTLLLCVLDLDRGGVVALSSSAVVIILNPSGGTTGAGREIDGSYPEDKVVERREQR